MGMDINVFRVDFGRLMQLPGSRNEKLFNQVVQFYALDDEEEEEEDDDEDEADEEALSIKDALHSILFEKGADRAPDSAYAEAVALIYPAVGAHIGDLRVASSGVDSFFRDADAVLTKRGFPGYFSDLVFAGCPLDVPMEGDTALGFIPPEQCERFSREYGKHDWSGEPQGLREAVADLKTWCDDATQQGHGLVAVGG